MFAFDREHSSYSHSKMKRFSTKAFVVATLIHLAGAWALFTESDRLLADWKRTGVESHPLWLAIASWIWEPVPLLLQQFPPWFLRGRDGFSSRTYLGESVLIWALCVGAIVGFLAPRFSEWRRRSSNRTREQALRR
jgi:hypothetical protein